MLRLAQRLFLPLALVFLGLAAWTSRDVVAEILLRAHAPSLLVAVIAWSALHLLSPLVTRLALDSVGTTVSYRTALGIHLLRLPARYLPGGIWQTVSRVADLRAIGVGKSQLAALVVLENAAPLAIALALAGTWLGIAGSDILPVPALVVGGIGLAMVLPWLIRRSLPTAGRISLPHYLGILASCVLFWTIAAAAFACYWSAFPDAGPEAGLPTLMGTYLLAWSAGFAAVFAPQGIGVFESMAGLMLDGQLPFALVAVMVAGFRAATLAGDMLAYGLCHLVLAVAGRARAN